MAKNEFVKDVDYYLDEGFVIMTGVYLNKRGYCCGNKCRHCPYDAKSVKGTTLKSFDFVTTQSTCQKRVIVCEIYDAQGVLLARESNRCNPEGGTCHRLGLVQAKEGYDVNSSCNWTHAEINALAALPAGAQPHKAVVYGHTFFCSPCEQALRDVGVVLFEIAVDEREWWNSLTPFDQQELADKYFPDRMFGALAVDSDDIKEIYKNVKKDLTIQ